MRRRRRLIAKCTSILNKRSEADAERFIRAVVPGLAMEDPSIQTGLSAFPPGVLPGYKADYLADVAIIRERLEVTSTKPEHKDSFAAEHPWITGMVCSFVVGLIVMFSFWDDVTSFIVNQWNAFGGQMNNRLKQLQSQQ